MTPAQAVEKKYPNKFFYAGWMGPERYALLAACDYTLLPSRWASRSSLLRGISRS